MLNIEELKRQKAAKVTEARAVLDKAGAEKRAATQEELTTVAKLEADIRAITDTMSCEDRLQIAEMAKSAGRPPTEDLKKEKRAAFFNYIRKGKDSLNPEERALVEDTTGLLMVPEDLVAEIYRDLPQLNVIRQLATVRQTTRDKVSKRSLTEVSVGWGKLETGADASESTPTPSKNYIYIEDLNGMAKIGKDELMDSDDILAQLLADSFARAIADAEAKAFVVGTGHTYGQPDGITLDATVIANYIDLATADTFIPDDVIGLEYALPAQYRNGASFMWHPTSEGVLRKVKASSNYLWTNPTGITGAAPRVFDGYPVYNSSDMVVAASDNTDRSIIALFGNWKAGYAIVDRLGLAVQRLDELYAEEGLVGFLAHFRVGGGVVRANAFRALDNNT